MKYFKKRCIFAGTAGALLTVCLTGFQVWAQGSLPIESARPANEIVALFDGDKDGRISRVELRLWIISAFDRFDRDRDDSLSQAEVPGVARRIFMAADSDRNGRLSVFEYSQSEFVRFENYDVNRDGFITAQEIEAYRHRVRN